MESDSTIFSSSKLSASHSTFLKVISIVGLLLGISSCGFLCVIIIHPFHLGDRWIIPCGILGGVAVFVSAFSFILSGRKRPRFLKTFASLGLLTGALAIAEFVYILYTIGSFFS